MASASVPGIHGLGNSYDAWLLGALDYTRLLPPGTTLDRKGFTTSLPGSCRQCHGRNSTYTMHAKHEVRRTIFLPFDLEALEFFRDDLHSSRSRIQQGDAFRAPHRMVHDLSRLSQSVDTRQLIDGWYDGDLVAGTLNGSCVPPAWSGTGQPYPLASPHTQLSKTVSAHACRTCHISYKTSTTRALEGCTIASRTNALSGQWDYWQRQRQKRRGRWW